MRRWGLLMGIAVLLAAPAAQAAFPGKNGKIAFAKHVEGENLPRIVTIDPDGSNRSVLTQGDDPAYSPDGRRIAFERRGDIFVMDASGRDVSRLTSSGSIEGEPAFSPDGNRIVFKRSTGHVNCGVSFPDRQDLFDLFVVDADGSNVTRLTADIAVDEGPAFAPNGRRVYFGRVSDACLSDSKIYAMPPLTGAPAQPVTKNVDSFDTDPSVAPDSGLVAFARLADFSVAPPSESGVYTTRPNGTGEERIAAGFDPAFSPNGRKIVFDSDFGDVPSSRLLVMASDGSGVRRLTTNAHSPDWGPAPERERTARCGRVRATIVGTPRSERIRGTQGRDVIQARAGDDVIRGRGGVDRICGGRGDDLIKGHRGPDRLIGGPGDDVLRGNQGRDALFGGKGFDRCFGGKGPDTARCERSRSV